MSKTKLNLKKGQFKKGSEDGILLLVLMGFWTCSWPSTLNRMQCFRNVTCSHSSQDWNRSSFQNAVFCSEYQMMGKSKISVIVKAKRWPPPLFLWIRCYTLLYTLLGQHSFWVHHCRRHGFGVLTLLSWCLYMETISKARTRTMTS
jgi:hypothetical protein